jgi:hypothetical protein
VRVDRFRLHHDGLADTDTLVAAFPENVRSAYWDDNERTALRTWIRNGGRLIDIGPTPSTQHADIHGESVLGKVTSGGGGPLTGPWSVIVRALPDRGSIRLKPQPHAHVTTLLADHAGILVARYTLGLGDVIAVTNARWFENRNLARGDTSRLAYLVGQPRHGGAVVSFDEAIRGDISEKPWYRALDVPERLGLALLALAGLAWLVYGFFRLGPAVRLRAPREPTSREFLDAVAALYARAQARDHARDALLADARRNLERAPRTPETLALQAQATEAANRPIPNDAALVGVALLARTAREEMIRAGRNAAPNRRRTPASRAGAGHRWG